ncbi:DUF1707 domain-containing protein [Streptomyces sp. NPDC029006]|uniref:DUF1707 SHOCT-like domain-containing protein n=1 Tax=Streptomyces sp. NPDC029006 TaxID=3155467 RepID=UPI0033C6661C
MTEEPDHTRAKRLRASDAERERAARQVQDAVGEGRIPLDELDHRLASVLSAGTRAEVEAAVADLPAAVAPAPLRVHAVKAVSRLDGRWEVPAVLFVDGYDALIRLDFRDAVLRHPEVRIELAAQKSVVRLLLPPGASVSVHGLALHKGFVRNRAGVRRDPPGAPHFTVTGHVSKALLLLR